MTWDIVVVGAGPAGCASALAALHVRPSSRVLVLDRAEFPRDKACGDGIAPHVLDVLADVGVHGLYDDWAPVRTLALRHGRTAAVRQMSRPTLVVPRKVFDARLLNAAVRAGAVFLQHRVRSVMPGDDGVVVDDRFPCRVVVAADGANSSLRKVVDVPSVRRSALAIRGYAPTRAAWAGTQQIVFGPGRQPSYAWSFDRGDGWSNVGYGEVLNATSKTLTRKAMLANLEGLLPGMTRAGEDWLAHHLPLSSWTWRHGGGRVLLVGDAAGLINPMTGEGIYYAVQTGVLAGRAAVASIAGDTAGVAGDAYQRSARGLLAGHLRHTATASALAARPRVLDAGIRAVARDQVGFDTLVELGLGRGKLTPRLIAGLVTGWRRSSSAGDWS
jgi:geranylgeranyl reductase family protein